MLQIKLALFACIRRLTLASPSFSHPWRRGGLLYSYMPQCLASSHNTIEFKISAQQHTAARIIPTAPPPRQHALCITASRTQGSVYNARGAGNSKRGKERESEKGKKLQTWPTFFDTQRHAARAASAFLFPSRESQRGRVCVSQEGGKNLAWRQRIDSAGSLSLLLGAMAGCVCGWVALLQSRACRGARLHIAARGSAGAIMKP